MFFEKVINIFDFYHQKRIINYIKKLNIKYFIDVGAHYGETIKLFYKNFSIEKIIAFEPSPKNFQKLLEKTKQFKNLKCYELGLGEKKEKVDFTQHFESSSSTLTPINNDSKYYKRKVAYLNMLSFSKSRNFQIKVDIDRLDNILAVNNVKKIDILKIDTEGHDFEVIKGLGNYLHKVKYIYFEHHFHNMLKKNYTLHDVNSFLSKNNFKKVFKLKMFFRKTFEYIYENNSL